VQGGIGVSGPSILHLAPGPLGEREPAAAPACFRDLNLDQLIAAVTAGRDAYGLRPLFYAPLRSVDEVTYRHEVFRDLDDERLRAAVEAFARDLRRMREQAEQAATLRNVQQRHRLHLDAALSYCGAVERLAAELADLAPRSRGFSRIADYLATLAASPAFAELSREAGRLGQELAALRYLLEFTPDRVTVLPLGDEVDLDAAVERAFTRFGPPPRRLRATKRHASLAMGRIEAAIFERVTKRFPELFEALEAFHGRFADYLR
jgi:DNA mismatch repair protein MutS